MGQKQRWLLFFARQTKKRGSSLCKLEAEAKDNLVSIRIVSGIGTLFSVDHKTLYF